MGPPDVLLRSLVPDGAKFGGNWRVVRRWAAVVEESTVDVFGGPEGLTTYFPRVEGLIR